MLSLLFQINSQSKLHEEAHSWFPMKALSLEDSTGVSPRFPLLSPHTCPHLSPSLEKLPSDKRVHMRNCTFLSLLGLQKASPLSSGWTQVYTTHRGAEFSMGSGKARLQTRPHPCSAPFLSSNCFPHFLSWEHTPNMQPRACQSLYLGSHC